MLRRLGSGASIEAVCAEAGLSRAAFDTWWSAELTSRLPQATGVAQVAAPGPVEILRDRWGIPHVFAETDDALFFGFGVAMAQDRLWQMDYLRRKALGRLAEVLGPDALSLDIVARTVGFGRIALEHLGRLPEGTRSVLTQFAAGVNAAVAMRGDRLPVEFALLDYVPQSWTPLDSLAVLIDYRWYRTGRLPVIAVPELAKRVLQDEALYRAFLTPEAADETIVPAGATRPGTAGAVSLTAGDRRQALGYDAGGPDDGTGSNNWLVDGSRSVTGSPLVASDPHLPFSSLSWWYEVHLCGGSFNAAGIAQVGVPALMMGRNACVAWCATNNICSQRDLYQERTDPTHAGCFLYNGAWELGREITEEIAVKGRGVVRTTVRFSRNGPIVDELLPPAARHTGPVSLRWLGTEVFDDIACLHRANRAQSCAEYREAFRHWLIPTFNAVFADREGHVGYQCIGRIPIRTTWDGGYRPGWDPEHQWKDVVPFEGLPALADPPHGWIRTANNRNAPPDFPYPLSGTWREGLRARRIRQMLEGQERFSAEDFARMQMDTLSLRAVEATPRLVRLLEDADGAQDVRIARAAAVLRAWNHLMEPGEVAATIFDVFFGHWCRVVVAERFPEAMVELMAGAAAGLAASLLAEDPGRWFEPGRRHAAAVEALRRALDELEKRLGSEMSTWSWGALHTLTLRHPLSGIGDLSQLLDRGGVPVAGSIVTVCNTGNDASHATATGAVYRLIADLAAQPPELRAVVAAGASGDPGSPHYCDQLPEWLAGRHHRLPLDRDSAARDAVTTLRLMPARGPAAAGRAHH